MLIISSRTSSCVLVLMQVLGALFECQGCVPPHIRKERSNLAWSLRLTAVLVAQAAVDAALEEQAHHLGVALLRGHV